MKENSTLERIDLEEGKTISFLEKISLLFIACIWPHWPSKMNSSFIRLREKGSSTSRLSIYDQPYAHLNSFHQVVSSKYQTEVQNNIIMAGGTTHHCPRKSKGGCRSARPPVKKSTYCKAHQKVCIANGKERIQLITEGCGICSR